MKTTEISIGQTLLTPVPAFVESVRGVIFNFTIQFRVDNIVGF